MEGLRTRSGFALLELLVVVFIVGMVSAVVIPNMSRSMSSVRLKTASRDVLNILRIARETAIQEQAAHKVRVDFVNRAILLTDAFGTARNEYVLHEDVEVEAIRVQGEEANRQEVVDVWFYPEGYSTGAELVLRTPNTRYRSILRTDPITGTVRIVSDQEADGR